MSIKHSYATITVRTIDVPRNLMNEKFDTVKIRVESWNKSL